MWPRVPPPPTLLATRRRREPAPHGLPHQPGATPDGRLGARPGAIRVQGHRRPLDGRQLPLGEHEEARRTGRSRHVGARGIRRPRPADPRHRADPRGNRQGLLRHRDGGAGRGRRADPRDRPLRPRRDSASASCHGRQRRLHAGDLHDRTACRHRRRQLPHQRAHRRRPRHPEGHQDADQPRAGGRHVHRVQPHRRQARPRRHRLRAAGSRHQGLRGHRHLSHHGRREPATRSSSTIANCRWRTW